MKALIIISVLALLSLLGQITRYKQQIYLALIAGLVLAFGITLADWGIRESYFHNMISSDSYSLSFSALLIACTGVSLLLSPMYYNRLNLPYMDIAAMKLFALAGGICIVSFVNLGLLFIGIELLSISSFVLAGSDKRNLLSNEASLKYFITGSVFSSFLLFGIALVYAVTGSFDVTVIGAFYSQAGGNINNLFYVGMLMIIIALGFKVAAAPFHFWAPDVYDGSPAMVTLFLSTMGKIAAFGAFLRLFNQAFLPVPYHIGILTCIMAVATMFIGNLSALWQDSYKRMLAYSAVAQTGYLLLVIPASGSMSADVLFYNGVTYIAASVIAFSVLLLLNQYTESESRSQLIGLAKQNPFLAFAVTVAMLSLAGIPPTAGFFGKYYLFTLAAGAGYTPAVVFAVISSLISIFFYFDIIIKMYTGEAQEQLKMVIPPAYSFSIFVSLIVLILLGVFPGILTGLLQ